MPRSGQIIPKYSFPHSETYINDYTIRTDDTANASTSSSTITYSLHVFPSPSGPDRVMTTINGGLAQFRSIFGTGDGKKYGQSYMNAYAAAASGGAILQCLRVTPKDAAYSNAIVWVGVRKNDGATTEPTKEYTVDTTRTSGHKIKNLNKVAEEQYTENVYYEVATKAAILGTSETQVSYKNGDIINVTADNGIVIVDPVDPEDPEHPGITLAKGNYLVTQDISGKPINGSDLNSALSKISDTDIESYKTYVYGYITIVDETRKGTDITYAVSAVDANELVTGSATKLTDVAKIVREWDDTGDADGFKNFDALYEAFGFVKNETTGEWDAPEEETEEWAKYVKYVPSMFRDTVTIGSSELEKMKYKPYIFAVIAASGRGSYGKKYGVQVQNAYTEDRRNDYKNHNLNVLDMETYQIVETYPVSFYENAVSGRTTIFVDDVVADVDTGSSFIQMSVNTETFDILFETWKKNFVEYYPTLDIPATIETFDPITGIEKGTKNKLKGLRILEPTPAADLYQNEGHDKTSYVLADNYYASALTDTLGVGLQSGRDGNFDVVYDDDGNEVASAYNLRAIDECILNGFLGNVDKAIKSKKRFPVTYILDAGYPAVIKQAINSLKTFRTDCVALYDAGDPTVAFTSETFRDIEADLIIALDGAVDVDSLSEIYNTMEDYILPLRMKVRDIASRKPVWVTYTFLLANLLPQHFLQNNGKHVPFAGAVLGKLSGFIRGTAQPVYEDDIDFDILDEYADNHVNYAKYNADGSISIAMQDTHQDVTSDLSELNAVLIMKDVKRDCENLIEELEYQFNEVSDVIRFNTLLEMRVLPYYSSAQVRSIRGEFSRNSWESERGILHLYIEIANKDLVKTGIIEIDVVQGDSQQ